LVEAVTIDRAGLVRHYKPDAMDMRYRYNGIPENFIFTQGIFSATPDDPAAIAARMAEIKEKRGSTQPVRSRTSGSTFANPTPEELAAAGLPEGMKAWQMIDKAGCRA